MRQLLFVAVVLLACLKPTPGSADIKPRRLDGHKGGALAVAFHPEGKVLASGGNDQSIILWDGETGRQIANWTAHKGEVDWLAFSPDGKTLASAGKDAIVCIWDPATKEKRAEVKTNIRGWSRFAFTPDSKTLIVTTIAGPTRFVDVATGKETLEHGFHGVCIALGPDGNSLVVGTGGGAGGGGLRLVEPAAKGAKVTRSFDIAVDAVAFHPEGKLVAAGYFERYAVKLWDVTTGKLETTIKTAGRSAYAMAFSRDGKTLAFVHSGQLSFWDMAEKRQFHPPATDHRLHQIAFHPEGASPPAADAGVRDRAVGAQKEGARAKMRERLSAGQGPAYFTILLTSETIFSTSVAFISPLRKV